MARDGKAATQARRDGSIPRARERRVAARADVRARSRPQRLRSRPERGAVASGAGAASPGRSADEPEPLCGAGAKGRAGRVRASPRP
mmetsp:Transcript_23915/g.73788  ORF Transcript_23915/g.73788 Transcript_23915/m.73788 type:complete len:87 (-) Transcript_23915:126-386(-)